MKGYTNTGEHSTSSNEKTRRGRQRIDHELTAAQLLSLVSDLFAQVEDATGQGMTVDNSTPGQVTIIIRGVGYDDGLLVPYTGSGDQPQEAQR